MKATNKVYQMSNNQKKAIYLFNAEKPQGEMFSLTKDEIQAMLEDGWVDTPALLDLPVNMDTGLTLEKVNNADPKELISVIEGYGFIVLTPEQLAAQAEKMANAALNADNLTDATVLEQAKLRGFVGDDVELEEKDHEEEVLLSVEEQFEVEPEVLTKPELIQYGNEVFGLELKMTMKEATLIDKIKEAKNAE